MVLQMTVLLIKGLLKPEMISREKKKVCFKYRHESTENSNGHSYQAVSSKLKNMFLAEHWGPISESFGEN